MPKSTVIKLIQQPEMRLRLTLLQRTRRRVSVTTDGAAYYERAGHVLSQLEEIDATLGQRANESARTPARGHRRFPLAPAS